MKSGAAFGGGGKIGSKTMKAQSVEADKKEETVKKKKKKKVGGRTGIAQKEKPYDSIMDRMYASA